jgi:hypothetical protein
VAIGFPAGITEQYIVNNAQNKLAALRDALEACHDYKQWLTAYAATDLEAAPVNMDSASATALFSAFADADALYQLYNTGDLTSPPSGYTTPGTYIFGASQRVIIGPLS